MTKMCPVCHAMVSVEQETVCPRCGGKVVPGFWDMSEEERASHVRKLAVAMKEGASRRSSGKAPAPADAVWKGLFGQAAGSAAGTPLPPAVYSETTPVPTVERDRFEYPEEFKTRIATHPPVVAGSAQLLKDHYDLASEILPVRLEWREWVKPLLGDRLAATAAIHAGRDLARSIHLSGPVHPVYVRLQAVGEKAVVAAVELLLPGGPVVLETGGLRHSRGCSPSEWKEPVTGMEFVWVDAGSYAMGAGDWDGRGFPHEKPVHTVCLDGFWMGKYPVTQGEWGKVTGSNPSQFKLGDRHPVECVSWLDSKQFIKRLTALGDDLYTFRLPTEAEWEYACRSGGKPEPYAGSADGSDCDALAWHAENSDGSPHEVGSKRPNSLGLHDMSGNVWEWCEDIYCDTAYERHDAANPVWCAGEPDRVIRGGSWYTNPRTARSCSRGFLDQTFRRHFVGLRLVRTP